MVCFRFLQNTMNLLVLIVFIIDEINESESGKIEILTFIFILTFATTYILVLCHNLIIPSLLGYH